MNGLTVHFMEVFPLAREAFPEVEGLSRKRTADPVLADKTGTIPVAAQDARIRLIQQRGRKRLVEGLNPMGFYERNPG